MDVRHLTLLRELADRGSLTAVATATFRTTSAVSQQLRTAEREIGVALVEPDGRGLRLTAAGELLAAGARRIERGLAELRAELDELQGAPAGTVTVGGLASAATVLLPGALTRLAGSRIAVLASDFDIAEADYPRRTGDHDIVLGHSVTGAADLAGDGVVATRLLTEPLDDAVPAGHPLAGRSSLDAADIAGRPWLAVPEGFPFDHVRIAVENRTGTAFPIVQRVRDNRLIEELVAAGHGLALLPRYSTRPRPEVALLPLTGVRSQREIVALSRADRAARTAVRAVVATLRAVGDTYR